MAPTTNPNTTHTPPRHTPPPPPLSLRSPSLPPPLSILLSSTFTNCHHIVPLPLSPVIHLLWWMPGWLLLPLAAACQVACRRTKSSPTLQSLYIHGVPNVLSPSSSSSSFCLSASHSPFQPTPLRGTRTPILIVAREPSLPERLVPAYDPDGARCK